MRHKILLVSSLSATLLLSFAAAHAAPPEGPVDPKSPPHEEHASPSGQRGPGEMFAVADTDGNGIMAERWKQADQDHNGTLSAEEVKGLPMLVEHFAAVDADHNGQLTREEVQHWHRQQH
jgi:hypothetical protein